jgi:hypothetical protein
LVIENRSCKDWHGDSFPQADPERQPCGFQTAPLPKAHRSAVTSPEVRCLCTCECYVFHRSIKFKVKRFARCRAALAIAPSARCRANVLTVSATPNSAHATQLTKQDSTLWSMSIIAMFQQLAESNVARLIWRLVIQAQDRAESASDTSIQSLGIELSICQAAAQGCEAQLS